MDIHSLHWFFFFFSLRLTYYLNQIKSKSFISVFYSLKTELQAGSANNTLISTKSGYNKYYNNYKYKYKL